MPIRFTNALKLFTKLVKKKISLVFTNNINCRFVLTLLTYLVLVTDVIAKVKEEIKQKQKQIIRFSFKIKE